MKLIAVFNSRLDLVLHNSMKLPILYFIFLFSIVIIILSPFYIRLNKAKPLSWILASLLISIILSLLYFIYIFGGFNV
ncbi:MAG: hypothetical protein ACP5JP_03440 [bacterium]